MQSELRQRLLLGNGASELIDLLVRDAAAACALPSDSGHRWCAGPYLTQYKEYERSARSAGFADAPSGDPAASLICIVNPSNPTGDFMPLPDLQAWIEASTLHQSASSRAERGTVHVLVDESMLMWIGPEWWIAHSLASQRGWLATMAARGVLVFVLHSWTKIWACPGLRLGSCVCPTLESAKRIRSRQPPWSVNAPALAFLSAAVQDTDYLRRTWEVTPRWRAAAREALLEAFPEWQVRGPPWASWLWVDTGSEAALAAALALARAAGLPVRSGANGYDHPTCFRMAVRSPEISSALVAALLRGRVSTSRL